MADFTTKYLCELKAGDEVSILRCIQDHTHESKQIFGSKDKFSNLNSYKFGIRTGIVGRLKVEHRPMLLVSFEDIHINYDLENGNSEREGNDKAVFNIVLQQAETVRLIKGSEEGDEYLDQAAIPVTSIKKGDKILVKRDSVGRHIGKEIRAKVTER